MSAGSLGETDVSELNPSLPSPTPTLHLVLYIILRLSGFMCNVCCVTAALSFHPSLRVGNSIFWSPLGTLCIQGPQSYESCDVTWAFGRRDVTEGHIV